MRIGLSRTRLDVHDDAASVTFGRFRLKKGAYIGFLWSG